MSKISFQEGVAQWMLECFGPFVVADKTERADRFIEEALELVQSVGYPAERVMALLSYVYGRQLGEPAQEVGGTMVTLAAFCISHSIDMDEAAKTELARVWTKIEAIRAKQAAKPTGSALPGVLDNSQFPHADLEAVDLLITAAKMKNKLYRARMKGRSGWDDPTLCTNADLSQMLREHVEKGDPVDVANFCAFLIARGERIGGAVAGWQTIDNAPKDGSIFLGVTTEAYRPTPTLCKYEGGRFLVLSKGEKFELPGWNQWWPTHWMLLPAAPARQESGSELDMLETHLKSLVIANPEKALLAALDDDMRMWFLAELIAVASGSIPLTEIEALVSRHLTPAKGGAA